MNLWQADSSVERPVIGGEQGPQSFAFSPHAKILLPYGLALPARLTNLFPNEDCNALLEGTKKAAMGGFYREVKGGLVYLTGRADNSSKK